MPLSKSWATSHMPEKKCKCDVAVSSDAVAIYYILYIIWLATASILHIIQYRTFIFFAGILLVAHHFDKA